MNQTWWDVIITGVILITITLTIWARVSGMTIPELLREIKDFFTGGTEELTTEAMTWKE